MDNIGRIKWVKEITDMWPKEADFTSWLSQNIDCLDHYLGLGLSNPEVEGSAGNLRVDIVADSNEGTVVIENQFGKSDHKHLGQLITYLAVKDTQRAIWIAEDPREEHIRAVNILNERGIGDVRFVKVEGIQIGNSERAPLFRVVAGPDPTDTPDRPGGDRIEKRYEKAYRFWVSLFEKANGMDIPHKGVSPRHTQQLFTPAIGQEVMYILAVNRRTARILCQNRGKARLGTYDHLAHNQAQIDEEFKTSGPKGNLDWKDDRENAGAWSIRYEVNAGYEDDSTWAEAMPELNEAAAALKRSLAHHLSNAPADEAEELT